MTQLRKIIATSLFIVAFMCVAIAFITFCVFRNKIHDVQTTAEICLPAAILLSIAAAVIFPGRLPVPGGR